MTFAPLLVSAPENRWCVGAGDQDPSGRCGRLDWVMGRFKIAVYLGSAVYLLQDSAAFEAGMTVAVNGGQYFG
jgi:hypothetical protein